MITSVPILYGMTPAVKVSPAALRTGRALKAQRVRVGLTQEQVVDTSDGKLYPRLISELETGKRSIADLSFEQAMIYMRILDYSPQALASDSGVEIPAMFAIPRSEEYDPSLELPQFGDVAAGLSGDTPDPELPPFRIDPTIPGIRGRPVGRLAVMRVNGDSMVSPRVSESIPRGAQIVVERGAPANAGDTVVAWIRELDLSVLKRFEEGSDIVLTSLNPNGPVFRASDYDINIRGVVRLVIKAP